MSFKGNQKMAQVLSKSKWTQVASFKLNENNDKNEFVSIRITSPPDNSCVITDIRKFRGGRALRVGVSLHPFEYEFVLNSMQEKTDKNMEFNQRKVSVTHDCNCTTINLTKPDGLVQQIQLDEKQKELFLQYRLMIIETIQKELAQLNPILQKDCIDSKETLIKPLTFKK